MVSFEVVIHLFSDFKYLKIAGAIMVSFLDPIRGLTPPDLIQVPTDPSSMGEPHDMLAKK